MTSKSIKYIYLVSKIFPKSRIKKSLLGRQSTYGNSFRNQSLQTPQGFVPWWQPVNRIALDYLSIEKSSSFDFVPKSAAIITKLHL